MRFENLDVWKRAARMSADSYQPLEESGRRPKNPDVGRLARQRTPAHRRQAIRPPPDSTRDRVKFLTYAKGSCGEVRTRFYIGTEAGILPRDPARAWIEETRQLSAMLYGLIKTMRQKHQTLLDA